MRKGYNHSFQSWTYFTKSFYHCCIKTNKNIFYYQIVKMKCIVVHTYVSQLAPSPPEHPFPATKITIVTVLRTSDYIPFLWIQSSEKPWMPEAAESAALTDKFSCSQSELITCIQQQRIKSCEQCTWNANFLMHNFCLAYMIELSAD